MVDDCVLNYKAPQGCGIVYGYYYKDELVYVGSTRRTIGERAGKNGKGYVGRKSSAKFGEFILLHGWENLGAKILATPKLSELTKVEDSLIDKHNLIEEGYNRYHACTDDEDEDEFTTFVDGRKANVKHKDKLRGDVRIGMIHDRTVKLNIVDGELLDGFYVSPSRGNKDEGNPPAFVNEDGIHTTVKKYLRHIWLRNLANDYNISIDLPKAEDLDDYRREVVVVNKVGRSDKKIPLIEFMNSDLYKQRN